MIKIIGDRGVGKTKQLIELARETPHSAILTKDKRGLKVKAQNYGYEDVAIYDYNDLEKDLIPDLIICIRLTKIPLIFYTF